ncbi:hypothetical protein HD554DRAFT_2041212 [Boletus coccyginus]|nr:hypothetical protein HD554DRAFT_2041212 [Boletus coccyginus]
MACEVVHSQNGPQVDIARSWRDHGIHVAVSMENVENVFVPQGQSEPSRDGGSFGLNWRAKQAPIIGVIKGTGRLDGNASDSLVQFIEDFVLIHDASEWQSAVLSPSFDRMV